MSKLKAIKIALLIVILAEEIRNAVKNFRIEYCDICSVKKCHFQLLRDENLTICHDCAAHFNDMNDDN
ncbi:hypothetical protein WMA08_02145 [Staphylococcus simulans]|uniref:hypothetical protein n=1 Tax=Staphylococcus simulans TaxID=1286 RepID=UPI0030BAD5D3